MKLCPECGGNCRDDAKQCLCGRAFLFDSPLITRLAQWDAAGGSAGVSEDSETIFGATPPQTTFSRPPAPAIPVVYQEPRVDVSAIVAGIAAILTLVFVLYNINAEHQRMLADQDRISTAAAAPARPARF